MHVTWMGGRPVRGPYNEGKLIMKEKLIAFWRDEDGLTTVEYAIAGGLVGATVIAAFELLGIEVGEVITEITAELDQRGQAGP